jgi:hypothetical protein
VPKVADQGNSERTRENRAFVDAHAQISASLWQETAFWGKGHKSPLSNLNSNHRHYLSNSANPFSVHSI